MKNINFLIILGIITLFTGCEKTLSLQTLNKDYINVYNNFECNRLEERITFTNEKQKVLKNLLNQAEKVKQEAKELEDKVFLADLISLGGMSLAVMGASITNSIVYQMEYKDILKEFNDVGCQKIIYNTLYIKKECSKSKYNAPITIEKFNRQNTFLSKKYKSEGYEIEKRLCPSTNLDPVKYYLNINKNSKDKLSFMKKDDTSYPVNHQAKIIVYKRDKSLFDTFNIWTKEKYIGGLTDNTFIEIKPTNSNLDLYLYAYNWNTKTNVNLKNKNTYYFEADGNIGLTENTVMLIPRQNKDFEEIKNTLTKIKIDKTKINADLNYLIEDGLELIRNN